MTLQRDLFGESTPAIGGLSIVANVVAAEQQARLTAMIDASELSPFRFGQWTGKRLTASFGSAYDYARGQVTDAPPLPAWLVDLRGRIAPLVGLSPDVLKQALLIRYDAGAAIGWHRDRPQYGEIIGLSLGAPAAMRFRRRRAEGGFDRVSVPLEPGSIYHLSGEVRDGWEHSIAPLEQTRWSVTFRTLRADQAGTP